MSVTQIERRTLGEPIRPTIRVVAGLVVAVAAVGHAALAAAAGTLFYLLAVGL